MESHHGKCVSVDDVVMFASGLQAPYCHLSNFSKCDVPIEFEGLMYSSAEHAFQAARFPQDVRAEFFSVDGKYSSLSVDSFIAVGVSKKMAEKKLNYWSKKNMIGVIPKMLVNRMKSRARELTAKEVEDVFTQILMSKYTRNKGHRTILLNTGDKILLEFVRSANSRFEKSSGKDIERWGGMVVNNKIVGHNQQGWLHMKVRDMIRDQEENLANK
jgi:predicted NAD-dependent protein-ADP-ribosyltransferase YbiA (DUF1768 family)